MLFKLLSKYDVEQIEMILKHKWIVMDEVGSTVYLSTVYLEYSLVLGHNMNVEQHAISMGFLRCVQYVVINCSRDILL